MQQVADCIWMVRPAAFYSNAETAQSNSFQQTAPGDFTEVAKAEFDTAVSLLRDHGVKVIVTESDDRKAPDAIFPNNWISFHADGRVVLYPMLALNRRRERKAGITALIRSHNDIRGIIDLSVAETNNEFLEGTGSIVFDHAAKIAYACRSQRTNENVLNELCDILEYSSVVFDASDFNGREIYHTNVLMSIGADEVVICLDAVAESERSMLRANLLQSGRNLVEISLSQMNLFAGNMLQVRSADHKLYWVMSGTAEKALGPEQKQALTKKSSILSITIPCIEQVGGGSIRCMMAEVFLPAKQI